MQAIRPNLAFHLALAWKNSAGSDIIVSFSTDPASVLIHDKVQKQGFPNRFRAG